MAEGSATDTHAVVRSYILMVCLPRVHNGLFQIALRSSGFIRWYYCVALASLFSEHRTKQRRGQYAICVVHYIVGCAVGGG